MKKVLVSAALVWVGAAVLFAQAGSTARPASAQRRRRQRRADGRRAASGEARAGRGHCRPAPRRRRRHPADAPKHQAWIKQYCVGCHNSRARSRPTIR